MLYNQPSNMPQGTMGISSGVGIPGGQGIGSPFYRQPPSTGPERPFMPRTGGGPPFLPATPIQPYIPPKPEFPKRTGNYEEDLRAQQDYYAKMREYETKRLLYQPPSGPFSYYAVSPEEQRRGEEAMAESRWMLNQAYSDAENRAKYKLYSIASERDLYGSGEFDANVLLERIKNTRRNLYRDIEEERRRLSDTSGYYPDSFEDKIMRRAEMLAKRDAGSSNLDAERERIIQSYASRNMYGSPEMYDALNKLSEASSSSVQAYYDMLLENEKNRINSEIRDRRRNLYAQEQEYKMYSDLLRELEKAYGSDYRSEYLSKYPYQNQNYRG